MADYYPLLARAAAGLTDASPGARQAMYARARKALLGQLGSMDPPLAEDDIAREGTALDEAIARVEADLFSKTSDASVPLPAPAPRAHPTPGADAPAPPLPEAAAPPLAPIDSLAASSANAATEPSEPIDEAPAAVRPRERPPAPTPPEPRGQHSRLWILGGVVAIVVAAVAAAALKLRNSPDELARLKPVAAPTAETTASGKIAERVGRDDTPVTSTPTPARGATAAAVATAARPAAESTVTQAPIPVAQRAALLIEAPDLESKVRTFLGSTIWRLDNVPAGSGQPLGTAVHADVEVPEAKVRVSLDLRKNTDPALPAASTIEVRFTLLPGSIFPGIQQIAVPQMRREENPNGDSLAGVPVKITDTYFLVGLAQGDPAARNNELMRSRSWIDIPIQLSDNRIAKIAIEKGAVGDRIVADALTTWAQ